MEFWKLDLVQEQNIIGVDSSSNNNNKEEKEEDADDDANTVHSIRYHDVARVSTFHWRMMIPNMITSWEQQATYLNTIHIDVTFQSVLC